MLNNLPLYGNNLTYRFVDVYTNVDSFLADFKNQNTEFPNKIPAKISDENAEVVYYLLYAAHGNDAIANSDVNQFKYRLFSTIFKYGPAWQQRLKIQDKLTSLNLDDENDLKKIVTGSTSYYNRAEYNGSAPTETILPGINGQNTTNLSRGYLEALNSLNILIETDVSQEFISKFDKLFNKIDTSMYNSPLYYVSEELYGRIN